MRGVRLKIWDHLAEQRSGHLSARIRAGSVMRGFPRSCPIGFSGMPPLGAFRAGWGRVIGCMEGIHLLASKGSACRNRLHDGGVSTNCFSVQVVSRFPDADCDSLRCKWSCPDSDRHARFPTWHEILCVGSLNPTRADCPQHTMALVGALSAYSLPAPAWSASARSPRPAPPRLHPRRLAATGTSTGEPSETPDRHRDGAERDAHAGSGAGTPADRPAAGNPAEEAAAVVAACVELMCQRRLDELVDFLPDAVLDRCLQRRKARCFASSAQPEGMPASCDAQLHWSSR